MLGCGVVAALKGHGKLTSWLCCEGEHTQGMQRKAESFSKGVPCDILMSVFPGWGASQRG